MTEHELDYAREREAEARAGEREGRLREIRGRLDAAPAGPWEVVGNTVYFAPGWWVAFLGAIPLAAFIAHSRSDLEFLLAEVEGDTP